MRLVYAYPMTADTEEPIIKKGSIGIPVEPNPWDGIEYSTSPNGTRTALSSTLPSAKVILIPVFVISSRVTIAVINDLLESSWTVRIQSQPIPQEVWDNPSVSRELIEHFILPQSRNPHFVMYPTDWPVSAQDLKLPFLGHSFADVLAAWLGTSQTANKDGTTAFRTVDGVVDKTRYWSTNCYLILDEQTMAEEGEPTALLVFLPDGSADETKAQTLRCELPVTLRFMLILMGRGGEAILRYVKKNIVGKDRILRTEPYDEWFKVDGLAEKDAAEGRFPGVEVRTVNHS